MQRRWQFLVFGCCLLALGAALGYGTGVWGEVPPAGSGVSLQPQSNPAPDKILERLKARVVSWDVGFRPATEKEWIDRVTNEVGDAASADVDVLLFPELFAAGLGPYAPQPDHQTEFITRRMHDAVLPAVKKAAMPGMLVVLGSYWHQEPDWEYVLNRAPVLVEGTWHFVDKLDPTPGELIEDPPIPPTRAGQTLPLFRFHGGTAAVVICFSMEMPEVSAALKKAGVQLVLAPSATVDEDGVARVLRSSSARAVELGAAVLVAPLVGEQGDDWKNRGSAALYLPAQKGIDHRPQESARRDKGISHDDFTISWKSLLDLHQPQPDRQIPETRPFRAPIRHFRMERVD
jgi:predicted amidohydrolase